MQSPLGVLENTRRGDLEILVPEPLGAVSACHLLDSEQLHDQVVDLNILERVHDIGIVRRRVPSFVGTRECT